MKLKFMYALAFAGALVALPSCSKDDPNEPDVPPTPGVEETPKPGSALEEKTYQADNLTLTLNGNAAVGKQVKFVPGEDGNATVTLSGEPLNVSELIGSLGIGDLLGGATKADEANTLPAIPTAGVLPGSPVLEIPVTLEGETDNCTFSGTGKTDYCTYSYAGSVSADAFKFNLTEVALLDQSLVGTWNMPNYLRDPEDPSSGFLLNVMRLEWKADAQVEVEMFPGLSIPFPIQDVLIMALGMPMFNPDDSGNPTATAAQMLSTMLKSVTFSADGEVTAHYIDTKTGKETESAPGFAQYVVTGKSSLRLFLNPEAIIANTLANTKASTRADIASVVEGLFSQVVPMFTQGIPVNYGPAIIDQEGNTSADLTSFYLDTDTLLPILKTVAPLMADEAFVNSIIEKLSADPTMGQLAGSLGGVLRSFPAIVESTEKIEIGINLKR